MLVLNVIVCFVKDQRYITLSEKLHLKEKVWVYSTKIKWFDKFSAPVNDADTPPSIRHFNFLLSPACWSSLSPHTSVFCAQTYTQGARIGARGGSGLCRGEWLVQSKQRASASLPGFDLTHLSHQRAASRTNRLLFCSCQHGRKLRRQLRHMQLFLFMHVTQTPFSRQRQLSTFWCRFRNKKKIKIKCVFQKLIRED